MSFEVDLKLSSWGHVLYKHGLEENGPVQAFFTNELLRASAPYTPFGETGLLQSTAILNHPVSPISCLIRVIYGKEN